MECSSITDYNTCLDNNCCWINNTCMLCSENDDDDGSILYFLYAGTILIASMALVYIIIYVLTETCKRHRQQPIRVYPYRVESFAEVTDIEKVNDSCENLPKAQEVNLDIS